MCFREGPGKPHKSLLPQDLRFAGFIDFQGCMRGTWIPIYVIGMGRALPLDALQRVADRGVFAPLFIEFSSWVWMRTIGILHTQEEHAALNERSFAKDYLCYDVLCRHFLGKHHLWITNDNAST